jgi:DNA repair protein RadC
MNELTKKILLGLAGTGAALGLGYWVFGGRRSSVAGSYTDVEDLEPMAVHDRSDLYPTSEAEAPAPKTPRRKSAAKRKCDPVELVQDVSSNTQILACRGPSLGRIQSSADAYRFTRGQSQLLQEEMVVLAMNSRNDILATTVVHRGVSNEVRVGPADVFRTPVVFGANRMILVHNHPSGDPTPSPSDVALTKKVRALGDELGIQLLDHVIVGRNDFTSLRDLGLME